MKRQWKIAVVYDSVKQPGVGHGTHLSFTGLPDTESILVDPNPRDVETRLRAIGAARRYADLPTMMRHEVPDILVVCSRLPGDHFAVIQTAAAHGCHVLCEKPLAASLADADAMAALAETNGVKIAVAHLARYTPVFRTLKRMVGEGAIGTPLTFYGRGKEDERGGGEDLMVLGTHILDLGVFLFGPPEYVFADVRVAGRPITAKDRSDTTEAVGRCAGDSLWATLRFPNGVNGVFESRRNLCTGTVRMGVTVAGTEGTLSVRYDRTRALRICRSSRPFEDEAHYEEVQLREDRVLPEGTVPIDYKNYRPQPANYFADGNRFAALDLMQAIENDRQPACSVCDAVTTLEIIYGIYRSSLTRSAVLWPITDRTHPLEERK